MPLGGGLLHGQRGGAASPLTLPLVLSLHLSSSFTTLSLIGQLSLLLVLFYSVTFYSLHLGLNPLLQP